MPSYSSYSNDRPTLYSAPHYNSIINPTHSGRTTISSGAKGYEENFVSLDSVSSKLSSPLRYNLSHKTMSEHCDNLKGKIICNQKVVTKNKSKYSDATKEKAIVIPESDLE